MFMNHDLSVEIVGLSASGVLRWARHELRRSSMYPPESRGTSRQEMVTARHADGIAMQEADAAPWLCDGETIGSEAGTLSGDVFKASPTGLPWEFLDPSFWHCVFRASVQEDRCCSYRRLRAIVNLPLPRQAARKPW